MRLARRPPGGLVLLASAAALGAACRRPVRTAAAPAAAAALPAEEYCWWTVFRTPLPADTVAARYARAFASVGLGRAEPGRQADTAWAQAGPAALAGAYGGATYTARVVAYRRGDSTHYRHFVGVARLPTDSVTEGGRHIGLCGALGRAAQAQGVAPRDPDGEERLDVWRRRP